MESYSTKKMDFNLKAPEGVKPSADAADEEDAKEGEENTPMPMNTAEMGAAVTAAIKAGDDSAVCEAICKIIDNYKAE